MSDKWCFPRNSVQQTTNWWCFFSNKPQVSGWWFQPLWKILVSWGYYSQYMKKTCSKAPTSYGSNNYKCQPPTTPAPTAPLRLQQLFHLLLRIARGRPGAFDSFLGMRIMWVLPQDSSLWLFQNSYWKWPIEIVDLLIMVDLSIVM